MTKEAFPYPKQEHYVFPCNQLEQVQDELRLYPTGDEFREFAIGLQRLYSTTTFMQTIREYAKLAGKFRVPDIDGGSPGNFNFGFYDGALLALHMNVAPAEKRVKRFVFDELSYPEESQFSDLEEVIDRMNLWSGEGEESWSAFFDAQTDEYQASIFNIVERIYDNRNDPTERSYDFILGYTLSSNFVWSIAKRIPPSQ